MSDKKKTFKQRDSAGNQIKSHAVTITDYRKLKPAFSLEYMGVKGYCISDCDVPDKAILIDALFKRSKMTWKQIIDDDHRKLGFEILQGEKTNQKLRKKALKQLTDDAKLKVFRAKSDTVKRFIGHREHHILYILFYDTRGDLYDHG